MRSTCWTLAMVLALAACGAEEQPAGEPLPVPGGADRGEDSAARNLVLISIDTLRADHMGCYGYDEPTTPTIDAFAGRGVVFEDASATSSWTISSHFSMLTGLYPRAHGVVGWKTPMPEDISTLASVLGEAGWDTGAFVNVSILGAERGFGRGFDTYEIEQEKSGPKQTTQNVLDRGRKWMRKRGEQPFFLFLHFYDVHSSYRPHTRFRTLFTGSYGGRVDGTTKQLKQHRAGEVGADWTDDDVEYLMALYDGGVRTMDHTLGAFLEELEGAGRLQDTVVVITSDHGEEFLEHGGVLHGETLHREVLRVPLILFGAGVPAGRRYGDPVCTVDLMPTALGLLGVDVPAAVEGVDLSRAWTSPEEWPTPNRLLYAQADKWFHQDEGELKRAVRSGRFVLHYAEPGAQLSLFDLEADPLEQEDVKGDHPELVEALWSRLQVYMDGGREVEESIELDEAALETLRELGYL